MTTDKTASRDPKQGKMKTGGKVIDSRRRFGKEGTESEKEEGWEEYSFGYC